MNITEFIEHAENETAFEQRIFKSCPNLKSFYDFLIEEDNNLNLLDCTKVEHLQYYNSIKVELDFINARLKNDVNNYNEYFFTLNSIIINSHNQLKKFKTEL